MANYLMRYKGTYRLKAHVDQCTNDFPRNINGIIESDDVYIKCAFGNQIYHYGRAILVAYIPSIGRGHNILKDLGERLCGFTKDDFENYKNQKIDPYKMLYEALHFEGTIKEIKENDEEIEFKFHSKNINLIAEYLKPQTGGSDISPFSTRNLPKSNYTIPLEDLQEYKDVVSDISRDDILIISQITKRFIGNILAKSKQYRSKNIKAEMRKSMLKGKEFIHYSGFWKQYISYLQEEINNEKSSKI